MFDAMVEPNQRRQEPPWTLERKQEWIDFEPLDAKPCLVLKERPVLAGGVRTFAGRAVSRREFEQAPRDAETVRFYEQRSPAPNPHQLVCHTARTLDMMHDIEIDHGIVFGIRAGQILGVGLDRFQPELLQPFDALIKILGNDVPPDLPAIGSQDRPRHVAVPRTNLQEILIAANAKRVIEQLYIPRDDKDIADIADQLLPPGGLLGVDLRPGWL